MKTILIPSFVKSAQGAQLLGAITTFGGLKDAMGSVIGILVLLSFIIAIAYLIIGIMKNDSDPTGAKKAFITAALLAAAPVLVTILFVIFGSEGATVAPKFN